MFDLDKGVKFKIYITNQPMLLKRLGSDVWIFKTLPNGENVSQREATEDEISAIRRTVERKVRFA